jgi:hypothetical protein
MIAGVLHSLHQLCLVGLPFIRQLFDAFISGDRDRREALRVTRLPTAVRPDLPAVVVAFIH